MCASLASACNALCVIVVLQCSFQDLNVEVLSHCTAFNVLSNVSDVKLADLQTPSSSSSSSSVCPRATFHFGDWNAPQLAAAMGKEQFDLILTSDTIYSRDSMPHLL